MHRQQDRHEGPLNSGGMNKLPAMVAALYDHLSMLVQPRHGIHQEVAAHHAEHTGRPLQNQAHRRSQKMWVATFDNVNSLPSSIVLMHAGGGTHYRPLRV